MHGMASEMTMRQHPWIRQRSIWKAAFMAAAAGCDAGTSCAGCEIPEFTVSGGDAAPQQPVAVQVAVGTRAQEAVDLPMEAGRDLASDFANGYSSGSTTAGASDASSDSSPGYTVVRRAYPVASPAVSEGAENRDAAATSSVGGSGEDAAPEESSVAAAVPPEPGLNAILVPVGGAPATPPPPANNVAPMSPRSITYPMPPVPGR
jgi:hypothetical protein